MARKLLIAIALIIAAFPHLGFTHSADMTVTTVLGLFMAAVLLFSKRPKMQKDVMVDPLPSQPSPFIAPMQELPIAHPKEESFTPAISIPTVHPHIIKGADAMPSPIGMPIRKRTRAVFTDAPSSAEADVRAEAPRRVRKNTPHVPLSEEVQVQPADIPFQPHADGAEEHATSAHS